MTALSRILRRFRTAEDGVAAIEMSLIGVVFAGVLVNAVEIARYGMTVMELNNAAQAGVAAANHTCDSAHLPATENCPAMPSAVAAALGSTSLGQTVAQGSELTEGWYCVTTANTLQYVSAPGSKPADCSGVPNTGGLPGLYLTVQVQYTYEPIFPGTLTQTFAGTLKRTAMARFL